MEEDSLMIPLNAELMVGAAALLVLLVLMSLRRRRAASANAPVETNGDEAATEARFRRFMRKSTRAKASTEADDDVAVATTGTLPAVAVATAVQADADGETPEVDIDAPDAGADEAAHEAAPVLDGAATSEVDATPEPVTAPEPVADPETEPSLTAEAETADANHTDLGAPEHPEHEAVGEPVNGSGNGHANGRDQLNGHDDHDEDDADLFFGRPYDHADDEPDWDAMRHPAPAMAAATLASVPAAETTAMDTLPAPSSATTDDALITRPGWPLPGDLEAWESADMADMSNHPSDADLGHWAEAAAARADNGAGFPPHDAGAGPGVNLSSPSAYDALQPPANDTPPAPTIGTPDPVAFSASNNPSGPDPSHSEGHMDPSFWEIGQPSAAQPAETWPPAAQPSETQQWSTPNNVAAPGGGTPEPTPAPAAATPSDPALSADDWWNAPPPNEVTVTPVAAPDATGMQRPTVGDNAADAEWWGTPTVPGAPATPAADESWWVAPNSPPDPAATPQMAPPAAPPVPEAATPVPVPGMVTPAIPEASIPPVPTPPAVPATTPEAAAPVAPRYAIPEAAPMAAEPQVVEQPVAPVTPPPVIAVIPEPAAPAAPASKVPSPDSVAAPVAATTAPGDETAFPPVPSAARVLPRLDAGAKNPPANGRFAVGGTAVAPGDGAFTRVRFRAPLSRPIIGWGIGDEPDYAPGTLVLIVDAVLNCSADGLAVLQDDGDPNRPEGFTLSLSSHAPGPFAVSGTYHVVSG